MPLLDFDSKSRGLCLQICLQSKEFPEAKTQRCKGFPKSQFAVEGFSEIPIWLQIWSSQKAFAKPKPGVARSFQNHTPASEGFPKPQAMCSGNKVPAGASSPAKSNAFQQQGAHRGSFSCKKPCAPGTRCLQVFISGNKPCAPGTRRPQVFFPGKQHGLGTRCPQGLFSWQKTCAPGTGHPQFVVSAQNQCMYSGTRCPQFLLPAKSNVLREEGARRHFCFWQKGMCSGNKVPAVLLCILARSHVLQEQGAHRGFVQQKAMCSGNKVPTAAFFLAESPPRCPPPHTHTQKKKKNKRNDSSFSDLITRCLAHGNPPN